MNCPKVLIATCTDKAKVLVQKLLGSEFEIFTSNVEQALDVAIKEQPAVVFLDTIESVRRFKANPQTSNIVVLTVDVSTRDYLDGSMGLGHPREPADGVSSEATTEYLIKRINWALT